MDVQQRPCLEGRNALEGIEQTDRLLTIEGEPANVMRACRQQAGQLLAHLRGERGRERLVRTFVRDEVANEAANDNYLAALREVWAGADYIAVNVSSPNTPNLRQLQDRAALDAILESLQTVNAELAAGGPTKPILVKVAPDLTFEALDEIVGLVEPRRLAGLVATNTTIARPPVQDHLAQRVYRETGGLSGRPLAARSTEVVRHLYRQTSGQVPILGVGGVLDAQDAWEKVTAGATLVQVYTGLVYEGPAIVGDIVRGLSERLAGGRWEDAVGSAAR
jgi:dihydroorotate dehydrogenase